jgi:hypothetical protein
MDCPHCQKEIPGKACPHCAGVVPPQSRFCMDCGESFDSEPQDNVDRNDEDLDLENRVLCPDGTCTGIIVDGKCSECRRTEKEAKKHGA